MRPALAIGEFSRLTHLTVKTLRHYHEVGLLLPAEVDDESGYRYYTTGQVPTAQVIRRFRDLGMPVEEVRAVIAAPDVATRNGLIAAHLERMEGRLEETQAAVASLRTLIETPLASIPVHPRTVAATRALSISETVTRTMLADWWQTAFEELHARLRGSGLESAGTAGALFANELFEEDAGNVVAFLPTNRDAPARGRARSMIVPSCELAVAVHHGSHVDVDRTYGALGTYVSEHALGLEGPVREYYPVSRIDTPDAAQWRTEIGWPIFRTADV